MNSLSSTPDKSHLARTRQLGLANLRAFETVARHLNFRSAGEELALSQPAMSRQIQSLEHELGSALFERHTRSVALTPAGRRLLQAVAPWTERLDATVRQIREGASRKSVSVTTFASFASMWLIPKLDAFQRNHPDMDIRVDASDAFMNIEASDTDLALRYGAYEQMPKGAIRLFDDHISPMINPKLMNAKSQLESISNLHQFTWIELSDVSAAQNPWLTWEGWLAQHKTALPKTTRWLRFNYTYQTVQAALAGQGMVLARLPLVEESLKNGDLIEPLPTARVHSPLAYWLVSRSGALERAEVLAFSNWLQQQARQTRRTIRETTSGHL